MTRRVWFYGPQWYWFGWRTLLPWYTGSDEYGRLTICLGWSLTGQIVIAYKTCYCEFCADSRAQTARWEAEDREIMIMMDRAHGDEPPWDPDDLPFTADPGVVTEDQ